MVYTYTIKAGRRENMKENKQAKFEESDACVFFRAFELTGDTQLARQFCKSMKIWNKTLLENARKREMERE